MNANFPTVVVVAIISIIFGFVFQPTYCATKKKMRNENLTDTILTNTKSTIGQPCEIPSEEKQFLNRMTNGNPLEQAQALEEYPLKVPYVGTCTAENNEMCGFIPPHLKTTTTTTTEDYEDSTAEDYEDSTTEDYEDSTTEDYEDSTTEDNEDSTTEDNEDSTTEESGGKMKKSSRKLSYDYLNEVLPEDTLNGLKNYPKRKKGKKSKSKLLKFGHTQLTSKGKVALSGKLGAETNEEPIVDPGMEENLGPEPGICKCGYRNEVKVGMKIFLEEDDEGICRGPIGFPCKTFFLGEDKDGLRGHEESCVSGICDMDGDMCAAVEIIAVESTDAATNIHKPTTTYFILLFCLAITLTTLTTLF